MRARILRTTLGVSLTVIAVMAVIMVWADWIGTGAGVTRRLELESDRVVAQLHEAYHDHGAVTEEDLEEITPAGRYLKLVTVDGVTMEMGDAGDGGPTATEPVAEVGVVTLVDTTGSLTRGRWIAAASILVVALLLAMVAVVLALRTSRRLTAPIGALADHAERLGAGDLRASGARYGISELDRLAASMDAAVLRIAALLAEERRLTVDATHQLKTPLTALSLRLEELAGWPGDADVRAEARAALEQVERLSGVVDDVLVNRRSPDSARSSIPLSTVIDQQLAEWRPAFDAAGRRLTAFVDTSTTVWVDPGPVGQVIATLVENSLVHGEGHTAIEAKASDGSGWVEVRDEGPGVPDELAARVFDRDVSGSGGTGLGLAAAQDAAVSVGGRLTLVRRRPAHFRLFLDLGEDPLAVGPEAEERAQTDPDQVG